MLISLWLFDAAAIMYEHFIFRDDDSKNFNSPKCFSKEIVLRELLKTCQRQSLIAVLTVKEGKKRERLAHKFRYDSRGNLESDILNFSSLNHCNGRNLSLFLSQ